MSTFQFDRPNPHKPSVRQHYKGGMWWAEVVNAEGETISKCLFTHAEALAKAYELAALNKGAAKFRRRPAPDPLHPLRRDPISNRMAPPLQRTHRIWEEHQVNTITPTGAHIMVQALCRTFVKQSPWDEQPAAWVSRALKLQDSINRIIGAKAAADDIKELVTSFEQLESIECGTHPDLTSNEARTVDNTLGLTEAVMARINAETWALLNNAGFQTYTKGMAA